jgi:hypothetical protein
VSNDGAVDAPASGMQLLLAGGLADAMAAVEATLGGVQRAAGQAVSGLAMMQAAGVTMSAVPPAAGAVAAPATVDAMSPDAAPPHDGTPNVAGFAPVPVAPAAAAAAAPVAPFALGMPVSTAMVSGSPAGPPAAPPPAPAPVRFAQFAPVATATIPTDNDTAPDGAPPPAVTHEHSVPVGRVPSWAPPLPQPPAGGARGVAGDPPRAMAPPAAPAPAGGPTGGDVFLDGSRVGTWVADHLAREAGRPQAGGTGFDSRMTAAWPGTLQGG